MTGKEAKCFTPDAHPMPPLDTAWLFLKGLGRDALEKQETLREVFTQWGAGNTAKAIVDPVTQTRRGTAIIQMQGADQVWTLMLTPTCTTCFLQYLALPNSDSRTCLLGPTSQTASVSRHDAQVHKGVGCVNVEAFTPKTLCSLRIPTLRQSS